MKPDHGQQDVASPERVDAKVLLEAERLTKHYDPPAGLFGGGPRRGRAVPRSEPAVRAVQDVSFSIRQGETLAIVGESGCGKSTTARLLLGLETPTSGEVRYRGTALQAMSAEDRQRFRRRVQLVFQDPFGSLNPRLKVGSALREVLSVHRLAGGRSESRIEELLDLVGLAPDAVERYPHEFSGGQRQRIGIARALAVEPEIIVADEPVSALDVSIQAQVLNLLVDLQKRLGLSYLVIAHDLAVVRQVADRVAVMYGGRLVEVGDAGRLYESPLHPYTTALLEAVPRPRPPARRRTSESPRAEPQTAGAEITERPDSGEACPYYDRCRHPARDELCASSLPGLEGHDSGRLVRCFKV